MWNSVGSAGSDKSSGSIQWQRYDSNGVAGGSEFQVNSHTTDNQDRLALATDSSGSFVVLWVSYGYAEPRTKFLLI